ncbi:HEAT repeat domain-containing protein [Kitasatospora sp. NPDC051914]|uniref:HEAT repeat domain-containing protein n=1 Tax=Kitasatospora sp. NPDC051914 TaxID=3154945 RepID=UPI00342A80DC
MSDHRDAALRLWGRQLYERQSDPVGWAEAVLRAAGRPPAAVAVAMAGRLDALPVGPPGEAAGRAHLLFRTVAKLAANLRGDGRYDADVGTRIGPAAFRLGELEPGLAADLGTALGPPPHGPASLVTVLAADLHGSRATRLRAVGALLEWAELGNGQARSALHAVASDHRAHDTAVWCRTLDRVALFGDEALEPGLLRALADRGHRGVRWSALACAELRLHRAVPPITDLLDHPEAMVREDACRALGRLADPAAVPTLAARLDDGVRRVRGAAARALASIGGDRALAVLRQALTDRRDPKSGHLASAIAAFGPAVVDELIALAADPDLRALACQALGSTGDPRSLPLLEHLAGHDHARTGLGGHVSGAARQALRTARRTTPLA